MSAVERLHELAADMRGFTHPQKAEASTMHDYARILDEIAVEAVSVPARRLVRLPAWGPRESPILDPAAVVGLETATRLEHSGVLIHLAGGDEMFAGLSMNDVVSALGLEIAP